MPSLLTRPEIIKERNNLINDLINGKYEIVSLESEVITYQIPFFEEKVFQNIENFKCDPWRQGDLLIIKVGPESIVFKRAKDVPRKEIKVFKRKPNEFRVFIRTDKRIKKLSEFIKPVEEFEKAISIRDFPFDEIDVWTTDNKAVQITDREITLNILRLWEKGIAACFLLSTYSSAD